MTTVNVEGEVVSALVHNSMYLFLKNQKCPFIPRIAIFPELLFYIPEVPFCLPEVSFYLMRVWLSNAFLPRWLYFPLGLLRAAWDDICLALKTSTWSMISYAFYSCFILQDSLENAISEDLEWLKLISWKYISALLNASDPVLFSKIVPDVFKCIQS